MFHNFISQDERKEIGGSEFIEIQYCKLKKETSIKKIVSVNKIRNWKDDSLYINIDDFASFISNYGKILNSGTYNNLETGLIDATGFNYYSPEQTKQIIKMIESEKPLDYQIFIDLLNKVQEYNGFYLLGIYKLKILFLKIYNI
jgi:hypothetical protein